LIKFSKEWAFVVVITALSMFFVILGLLQARITDKGIDFPNMSDMELMLLPFHMIIAFVGLSFLVIRIVPPFRRYVFSK